MRKWGGIKWNTLTQKIFGRYRLLTFSLIFLLFFSLALQVLAVRSAPYKVGESINPFDCAPGDPFCFVALLESRDEGSNLTFNTSVLNFAGAGVTATDASGTVTVTIPGGASTFTGLTDVPNSYAGAAFLFPSVNSTETGLVFSDIFSSTPITVRAGTTGALSVTYNNGASGVGATLTESGNGALPAQDTVSLIVGDRLLVKNQTGANRIQNGVYIVTSLGSAGTPYVLTRATDSDQSSELDPQVVFVTAGVSGAGGNARKYFTQSTFSPVVGIDDIVYTRGPGGGARSLALPSGEIAFGTGTGVTSSSDLSWDTTNKTFKAGDWDATGNSTTLILDDSTQTFQISDPGINFTVDGASPFAAISLFDGTQFIVQANTGQFTASVVALNRQFANTPTILEFIDGDGSNFTGLQGPVTAASNLTYILPTAPTEGQVLFSSAPSLGVATLRWNGASNGTNLAIVDASKKFAFDDTAHDSALWLNNAFFAKNDLNVGDLYIGSTPPASGGENTIIGGAISGFGGTAPALTAGASQNVIIGDIAAQVATSPTQNVLIGSQVGNLITSGSSNVIIGSGSGVDSTGNGNTIIGAGSGSGTASTNLTIVGREASATGVNRAIVLGVQSIATADHQFIAGSDSDSNYISDIYFGNGVRADIAGSQVARDYIIHGSGAVDASDIIGGSITLAGGKATGNAAGGSIIFQTSDAGASGQTVQTLTTKATLLASGSFGLGDTTPDYFLDVEKTSVDTNIFALHDSDGECLHNPEAGSEVVTCSSDAALKTNVSEANSMLTYLNQFDIRQYDVIASGDHMVGVIAQEVATVHPELVSVQDNGYLSVASPNTWQLIKAIQELDIKIEPLTTLDLSTPLSLGNLIKSYLENITNGLQKIFVGEVHTGKLCVGETCVTETQLQQLLNQQNGGGNSGGGNNNGGSSGGDTGGGNGDTPPSDTTAPVITLLGDITMTLTLGDIFTDPGATAVDETDGDLTSAITVDGTVDTMTLGTYTLTYSVHDSGNNTGTITRTVEIIPLVQEGNNGGGGEELPEGGGQNP